VSDKQIAQKSELKGAHFPVGVAVNMDKLKTLPAY
jgi:hypothetical protein